MKKWIGSMIAGLALMAGTAFAASPVWSTAAVPTSVEIGATHSPSSPYSKLHTHLIIYKGGVGYVAPYTLDETKYWAEMARDAFNNGKSLRIFHDTDSNQSINICGDYNSSNTCISGNSTGPYYRIERISLQ
jgi:hypothetical protein